MKTNKLKLLILDDKEDIKLIKRIIKESNFSFAIKAAESGGSFKKILKSYNPDLIISDFKVMRFSGLTALSIARKIDPSIPFIFFTSSVNEQVAVKCLKSGAWDYILKEHGKNLIPAINLALRNRNYALLKLQSVEVVKKSEERYRNFIQQSTEGIFRIELKEPIATSLHKEKQFSLLMKNSYIAECNDDMAKMHGYNNASDLVGMNLSQLITAEDKEDISQYKNFIKNGYKISDIRVAEIDPNGYNKYFLNNFTGIVENSCLVRIWGLQRDITEMKKVEEALRKSEERFKLIFDNLLFGIYQLSINGGIIFANPAIIKMLGYSSFEELVASGSKNFINEGDKKTLLKLLKKNKVILGNEIELIKKDGRTITVRQSIRAVIDDKGDIDFIEGIVEDISDRKKIENALIESEERFTLMADTAPVLIWIAGADKLFFYLNKAWLEFTGETLLDQLGNKWMDRIHPGDIDSFLEIYLSSFENNKEFETVFRLRRFDSEYRWVLTRGIPRYLPDGSFTGYIGTAIDITDRKLAEDTLKESEELYKSVVNSLTEGLIITDINDKVLFASKGMSEITLYDMNEMVGNYYYKLFFEPDQWKTILEKNQNRFSDISEHYEIMMNKKDGEKFWAMVNGSPYRNSCGKIIGSINTINDVSKNKLSEKALKESEEKYRSVVENVREVIFKTDTTGAVTFLNPYWSEMTGWEKENAIGKSLFDFIHPDDKKKTIKEFISIIYKKKDFCRFEVRIETIAKNYRWFLINARIIIDDKANIIGTYGTLNDIHDRRLAEEELIKAKDKAEESDRLKSSFLAQISHEIRSPLNIILGYNTLIQERLKDDSSVDLSQDFKIIEASCNRLLRTIDLVLNMSLIQTTGYEVMNEEFDINYLIESMLLEFRSVAETKRIKLLFINHCTNSSIIADKYTLVQAFQNLLDNAVKFTDSGSVEVISYELDNKILIEVSDTGIGISEEYLPRLFEPFSQEEEGYSRKFEGNGLGLALTKKYIDLNHGDITVKSKKGIGTTFTIILNRNIQ